MRLPDVMTADEYRRLTKCGRGRRNKYGAKPTEYNGVRYASRAEADRAALLDGLQRMGLIWKLRRQPRYMLGVTENVYVADFEYETRDGVVTEDVKGRETAKFRRDRKLWKRYGPNPLHVVRRKGNGWNVERIDPTER